MTKPDTRGMLPILMGIALLTQSTNARFVCPPVTEVAPCDCARYVFTFVLHCVGPDITQDVLNRVVAAMKRENEGELVVSEFSLRFTNLVELDLTPFEGGMFLDGMDLLNNSLLSRVTGPDLSSTDWLPLDPGSVHWNFNNFTDEGLQSMLSYFDRTRNIWFYLGGNKLTGTPGQEFLPGFSDLHSVTLLDLKDNNIQSLGGGQFQGMANLVRLNLENNGIIEIGEDAFVLDEPEPGSGSHITINLSGNNLSDESFHPSSGITNTKRLTDIFLDNNKFTQVREDQFLRFLEGRPGTSLEYNKLHFEGNPIWCDPGMKWLKDRREEFEIMVTGLDCVNDPGYTAFTSSLVDG